jgi:DNA-binding PadR family transcriptional regulator
LDYNLFSRSIQNCWPCITGKSKLDFRKAVASCISRLQADHQSFGYSLGSLKSLPKWSICSGSWKESESWATLRLLSDVCVEMAIHTLGGDEDTDHHHQHNSNSNHKSNGVHSSEDAVHLADCDPFAALALEIPNELARRKSIHRLQAQGFLSISSEPGGHVSATADGAAVLKTRRGSNDATLLSAIISSQTNGLSPFPSAYPGATGASAATAASASSTTATPHGPPGREQTLAHIEEHHNKIEKILVTHIAKQNRFNTYLNELEVRLETANKAIETSQVRIGKTMKPGVLCVLTEAGKKLRVAKLEKIASSVQLLRELTQAELLLPDASDELKKVNGGTSTVGAGNSDENKTMHSSVLSPSDQAAAITGSGSGNSICTGSGGRGSNGNDNGSKVGVLRMAELVRSLQSVVDIVAGSIE